MPLPEDPCLFAAEPLDRASSARMDAGWMSARLTEPSSIFVPLFKGDPLIAGEKAGFFEGKSALFPADAAIAFLGLKGEIAHFAVDVSAEEAPFAERGRFTPLREAASLISDEDLAIIAHGRWLLDWHRRHRFCANCGSLTVSGEGGVKRQCTDCKAEHFPRSDPVAIVLAEHQGACLLGRSPRFPPGVYSALAGFVEAAETPEACAIRELKEEAGVTLIDVRYQFSQPWPFPSSLMMGFIAIAASRDLHLDRTEIEDARWVAREEIRKILGGETRDDLRLPPRFTIARRLIERWAL